MPKMLHQSPGGPWIEASAYPNLKEIVSDIAGSELSLLIATKISLGASTLEISSNITLQFLRGGSIHIESGEVLLIKGSVVAGFHKIFDGEGAVVWGGPEQWDEPQPLNQLWFGTDDDALQRAVSALAGGGVWYLPAGVYKQTTKIILPNNVAMRGDGPDKTIICSNVSGQYAIHVIDRNKHKQTPKSDGVIGIDLNVLQDFFLASGVSLTCHIGGDDTRLIHSPHGDSLGIGGILIELAQRSGNYKIENIKVEGFRSDAAGNIGTPGNPDTELRCGIEIEQQVDLTIKHCYLIHNDVGLFVHEALIDERKIINTTSRFQNCVYRGNRTHAIKLRNAHQFIVEGGYLEGNLGKYTVHIEDSNGTILKDLWLEGNVYALLPGEDAWKGSRDIYVNMTEDHGAGFEASRHQISLYNVSSASTIGIGGEEVGPQVAVELAGYQSRTSFYSCEFGGLIEHGVRKAVTIGENCDQTLFVGCGLFNKVEDFGTGTTMLGCTSAAISIGDSGEPTTGGSGGPEVSRFGFSTLPPYTVNNLQGSNGQIIYLRGNPEGGSCLLNPPSGETNFKLANGSDSINLAPNAIITLRKDLCSGAWEQLALTHSTDFGLIENASLINIDSRTLWLVPDAAVTTVDTINGGYHGQEITIIGNQSTDQICFFVHGSGNLRLSGGANFAVGTDNVLRLIYHRYNNKWYEISRS